MTDLLKQARSALEEISNEAAVFGGGFGGWVDEKARAAIAAIDAQQAATVALTDAWRKLYRRAVNEANGLTNYVDDRPELRRAERNLTAIEAEARSLDAAMAAGAAAQGGE